MKKNVNSYRAILPVLLLIILFSCKTGENPQPQEPYSYSPPEQTGDGWETASLLEVGMDETPIVGLVNNIRNRVFTEVHAVVIIKDGKLVFEEYFQGHDFGMGANFHGGLVQFNRDTPHNTHSTTKSFVSALVGIAIDHGFINSVDDKIFDYFTQYAYLNTGNKNNITIRHLLTMTSGFQWNEWDVSVRESEHDLVIFNQSPDPMAYLLGKPLVAEPGTTFYYNGAGVDALGEIIRIASDRRLDVFSGQYLFRPLGINNYEWQTLSNNIICGHGDVYIRPRDMAKFGYLFLRQGDWNGSRIISGSWVTESTMEHVPLPQVSWVEGYGYLWWLKTYSNAGQDIDAYRTDGWGGQEIIVFSDLDMIVVFTGANYVIDPPCDTIVNHFILPAVM